MAKKGKFQEPRTTAQQQVAKSAGKSSPKKKKQRGTGMAVAAAVGFGNFRNIILLFDHLNRSRLVVHGCNRAACNDVCSIAF